MKKILFIHHAAGWGGAPNSMIKLINSLDKTKYSAEVLLLKNSVVCEHLDNNNIPYHIAGGNFYKKFYSYYNHTVPGYTKWYQLKRQIIVLFSWLLSRYYFAYKELNKFDCDIIHLNSSVLTDWLAPGKAKAKSVIHIREPLATGVIGIRHRFFTYQMKKYADRIIAISEDNKKRVGVPEKTTVIYNYVNISTEKPSPDSYKSKKILYVGGASYIKGFYTLVDALPYLDSDITVYFLGNYPKDRKKGIKNRIKSYLPQQRKLHKAMKKLLHSKNALLIGLVPDITKYFSEVCCLVSPFSVEHFSRPIIEAFANFKPVIATKIAGMSEIVDHNINGIMVNKDNPEELSKAINFLCSNSMVAKEMGINGYEKANKNFSVNNINKFEEVYDQL